MYEDGSLLLSGGDDGQVRVWDIETGELARSWRAHHGWVLDLAVLPDGRLITASNDRTLGVWDAAAGLRLGVLEGHAKAVTCVAVSPSGDRLLSGSDDQTARLWDVQGGRQLAVLEGHQGPVQRTAFSPDRKLLLLSAFRNPKTVVVWDVEAGREVRRLDQPGASFTRATFCPDGRHAVLGGDAQALEEVGTGRLVRRFAGADVKDAHRLAVSPDGKVLHTSGIGLASRLWDLESGRFLREITKRQRGFPRPAFTPDSRLVLDGGRGEVRLWDVRTGKEAGSFEGLGEFLFAAFSRDGGLLVTGHREQGDLRVWDVNGRKEIVRLKGHSKPLGEGIDVSSDGKYAASSSRDGTVRVGRLPRAGAVNATPPVEDEFATLTAKLNDLKNWTTARSNNWQSVAGGFTGRGADNSRFNEHLLKDYALTFDMNVQVGKRPRVFISGQQFAIMVAPKVGDDSKLHVQPRARSPGMRDLSSVAIPYRPNEVTKIKFVFSGDVIECWINGKPAAKATHQYRGPTQLEVSCGDPTSPGLVEFTSFKIAAP